MKPPLGQSLTEYAMVIGLVGVVTIGGLSLLGEHLDNLLTMMHNTWTGNTTSTENNGNSGSNQLTGVIAGGAVDQDTVFYTLPNGEKLPLAYPRDLDKQVETDGVNGATQAYATYLEELAAAMLDAGEISEGEAEWLRKMSQGAFEIAARQKLLDDTLKDPSVTTLAMMSQIQDPTTNPPQSISLYTLEEELARMDILPFSNYDLFQNAVQHPSDYQTIFEFGMLGSYIEAKAHGHFQNPQLDALLKDALQQVGISGFATRDFLKEAVGDGVMIQPGTNPITEQYQQTSQGAGTICTASDQNTVQGLSCQKQGR